ncbi:MAG: hypothetical protein WC325_09570 [Candidatus Bathyarchaeia archaeon]|jgi:hypothetical protein
MKTKKQILEEMISGTTENIYTYEIMERYLSQKIILAKTGKSEIELALGKIQRDIQDKRSFLAFLERTRTEHGEDE